jgi:hypothetical protein
MKNLNKNDVIMNEMENILDEWGNAYRRGTYSSPEWKLAVTKYKSALRKLKTLANKLDTK